ncbi:MAG: adenosine deaminase [Chloroflexota bacterium]
MSFPNNSVYQTTTFHESTMDTACRQFNHMLMLHRLKMMPKIDLHRHFEGSLRLETLASIAKAYKMDLPHDPDGLRPFVQMVSEEPSADTFLGKFKTLHNFYRTPEIIWNFAYQVVEDAAIDNITYLEVRFNPYALARFNNYPLDKVVDWVIDATRQAAIDYKIMVNLIITMVRHDPIEKVKRVAEIAFERFNRGIVGLDLAGDAMRYPSDLFTDIFVEAQRQGIGITIHAGEWMPAETVRQAVETLGAHRIGHGVRSFEDPNVIALLKERDITLEMCLTSNIHTAAVSDLKKHPIKHLLRQNVNITLNTDDPLISDITLTDELATAMESLSFGYPRFYQLTQKAAQAAFASDKVKAKLTEHISQMWSDDNRYNQIAKQLIDSAPNRVAARNAHESFSMR